MALTVKSNGHGLRVLTTCQNLPCQNFRGVDGSLVDRAQIYPTSGSATLCSGVRGKFVNTKTHFEGTLALQTAQELLSEFISMQTQHRVAFPKDLW
jgi:hypothetical protein